MDGENGRGKAQVRNGREASSKRAKNFANCEPERAASKRKRRVEPSHVVGAQAPGAGVRTSHSTLKIGDGDSAGGSAFRYRRWGPKTVSDWAGAIGGGRCCDGRQQGAGAEYHKESGLGEMTRTINWSYKVQAVSLLQCRMVRKGGTLVGLTESEPGSHRWRQMRQR